MSDQFVPPVLAHLGLVARQGRLESMIDKDSTKMYFIYTLTMVDGPTDKCGHSNEQHKAMTSLDAIASCSGAVNSSGTLAPVSEGSLYSTVQVSENLTGNNSLSSVSSRSSKSVVDGSSRASH